MDNNWFARLFSKSRVNGRTAWAYSSANSTMSVNITNGKHMWVSDEPPNFTGNDLGPNPVELLMGSLAACSVVTILKKARDANFFTPNFAVVCSYTRVLGPDGNQVTNQQQQIKITRSILVEDTTDTLLLDKLKSFSDSCPVETILTGDVSIETNFISL
jgi:putative redox protein